MKTIKENFYYISETSIPSKSANSIHVAKMLDAFSNLKFSTTLIVPYCNSKIRYKKFYNIKNKVKIISIFNKKIDMNFFYRIIYSFKVFLFLKKIKNKKILSRSILASLILSYFKIKNIVEIHHQLKGFTNILFKMMKLKNFNNCQNFILIHKNLKSLLNVNGKKVLILDDAVNLKDFQIKGGNRKKKNSIVYIGSFYRGKGLETIYSIAKMCPELKFDLFGDLSNINLSDYRNLNLNFHGFIPYNKIPKLLAKYEYAIMPYGEKIQVRSSNLDVSNTMSPLKMFDYLASGKIIFASNLSVYKHILKNNYNAILIKNNSIKKWIEIIKKTKKNVNLKKIINRNALKTAEKYSWEERASVIRKKFF